MFEITSTKSLGFFVVVVICYVLFVYLFVCCYFCLSMAGTILNTF